MIGLSRYFLRYYRKSQAFWLPLIMVSVLSSCGNTHKDRPDKDSTAAVADSNNRQSKTPPDSQAAFSGQSSNTVQPVSYTLDIRSYKSAIAPFKIRLVDGTGFTYKNLVKGKQTILVYFQPDCPECQAFVAALEKKLPELTDKQIILISFAHIKEVKDFDAHYHLSSHPNVKIGSEGYTFLVQKYYRIEQFPFVACYNKAGTLARVLNPRLEAPALAALL